MEIKKYVLDNGLTILHVPTKTKSVTMEVLVNTGSLNENKKNNGISHLIEHVLFEGSTKFKNNRELTSEIEKVGGVINAYTSKERTCYYVKILNKYFDKAVDTLLDIIRNPFLRERDIEKEKKVICREIDMLLDQPQFYQWLMLNKALYPENPISIPTYGDTKVLKSLTRKDVLNYFNKYYVPNNIIISVVGNVKDLRKKISDRFKSKSKNIPVKKIRDIPLTKNRRIRKKKKVASSYFLLGFKAPNRNSKEKYIFNVIQAILGKGMSGRLFHEISSKRSLAYDIGPNYINEKDYGYFAIHANVEKKDIEKVKKLILKELKLNNLTDKELEESKKYIEGSFYLLIESTENFADVLGIWEQANKAENLKEYIKNIKKVSMEDVKRVAKKYFSKPYAEAIIEGNS